MISGLVDYTGRRFVNGATVLRCEGRIRIGTRTLPAWVIQCPCETAFVRSSQNVARSLRLGRASLCDVCERAAQRLRQAKLTMDLARIARELVALGRPQAKVAIALGVSRHTVCDIVAGKIWVAA